ncbi:MAG: efflux RND transporter periplasmic adaptor subunit [Gammaproteobacteria bacterium]|nr:efflux RND transporter periplasmic adaptor subunit [Gammaproteobacteria bacterium]
MPFAIAKRSPLFAAILFVASTASGAEPAGVAARPLADLWQRQTFSAPASVVARNAPELAAEIDARIVEVAVEVGDRVVPGQSLVTLDCRRYEATLASAEAAVSGAQARLRFAEQQLARARNLRKNNSISEETLDQRNNELAVARADLDAAQQGRLAAGIDVGHCRIDAPFDAVVSQRQLGVGDYAVRGRVVIGLVETSGQEVSTQLRHDQVDSLLKAATVAFESHGRSYPLRLRAIVPSADPVARTREARLVFSDETVIVGSAGRVTWRDDRQLVPADFLVRRDGRLGLFIVDGDQARFVTLPDAQDGRPAASDLGGDVLLITEGQQSLSDGDAVRLPALPGNR